MERLRKKLNSGGFDALFAEMYGARSAAQRQRYAALLENFEARFGARENAAFFSAPGRTEICGNHTDHNHGLALAAAVDLDIIAVAAPWDESFVCLKSEGHDENRVSLEELMPRALQEENPHSNALIRGILARFRQLGRPVGGFCACTTADVRSGSGLSSSAAFEILLCTILHQLYGNGDMDPVLQAQIAQYAENEYYHKPSGMMDQTAAAVGHMLLVDFASPDRPAVTRLPVDPGGQGAFARLHLCVTAPGGTHARLTDAYASITREMRAVARALGVEFLRDARREALLAQLPELRVRCGDRAVLRALHFFDENERVERMAEALRHGRQTEFLRLVRESGQSSFMYLQNVTTPDDPACQELALALCLSQRILGENGAYRVHGGGFAGTIQAFVPDDLLAPYCREMDAAFGDGACCTLSIRSCGGIKLA